MRYTLSLYLLAVLTLFMAWGFYSMERLLIEKQPLEEITVTIPKLPELTFLQLYCNNRFKDVTQAGPHLKCLRTDI